MKHRGKLDKAKREKANGLTEAQKAMVDHIILEKLGARVKVRYVLRVGGKSMGRVRRLSAPPRVWILRA